MNRSLARDPAAAGILASVPSRLLRGLLVAAALCGAAAFVAPDVAARTLYEITADRAQVKGDDLEESNRKAYKLKREGSGVAAQIVDDAERRSRVIVFRTPPTPAGKVKDRSELEIFSGIEFGRQWALGMKVFVPAEVEFSDNWHILSQCPQNGAIHPPFTLSFVKPGRIAVISRSDADDYRTVWAGDFPKARWVRLELEFTMGEKGHVRMWMDDKLVADKDAVFNFKEGRPRCNLKVGTYRGKTDKPFEVRFDDIRLGNERADVVDR